MVGHMNMSNKKETRMRDQVQSIYNRQVAKCLSDIGELWEIPTLVEARIKKAIEFTCKDVDKLSKSIRNPNGANNETQSEGQSYNR